MLKEISRLTGKDERTIAKEVYKHRFVKDLSPKKEYCNDKIHVGICPRLKRFPRCCNGCIEARFCRYDHYYYDAEQAQKDYRLVLKETRSGVDFVSLHFMLIYLLEAQAKEYVIKILIKSRK